MCQILVIDDDSLQRASLRAGLEKLGHEVYTAENGLKALRMMSETSILPSVVITDMVMPEMDGLEVIQHFRVHYPGIPVVAISGEMPESFLHLARRLGARMTFRKPMGVEQLQMTLEALLT
jgi:CheY-like chemotaxis protein